MAVAGVNIGMMSSAYFVGRKAILEWLNTTFSMSLNKIEDMANGAVALQITDALFPGSVPMSKVRWDARTAPEMMANYKLLQQAFDKSGVAKHIDVETLIRAKYQHNLEFAQFLKSLWDSNASGHALDEPAGRTASGGRAAARSGSSGAATPGSGVSAAAARALDKLRTENAELRKGMQALEREREFYFSKLRDVEILLQTTKSADKKLVETVFKILYATEDDFEAPPEGQAAATGAGTEAQAPAEEHAAPTTAEGEAVPAHAPKDSFGTVEPGEDGELVDAEEI
ncbi:hypothetical protein FNF27_00846 [Cafeteria roenbergensis]|uniref:EB1 C-terminal domain-containing protein n=1 Tax=Cafeteria roenbergensis TaxID=33653 RepID=A0A5A8EI71_CAFRO|nr:hypothetical protein FNF27_00846 [Cafeteria roenbergensis]